MREAVYRRKASILPLHNGRNIRLVAHLSAFARSVEYGVTIKEAGAWVGRTWHV